MPNQKTSSCVYAFESMGRKMLPKKRVAKEGDFITGVET